MSLANQDPFGRLDVAGYRLAERLTEELEKYWGVSGIWATIKDYVEDGIEDIKLKQVPEPLIEAIGKVIEMRRNQVQK